MPDERERRKVSERAFEIWKGGGKGYAQSIDEALAEMNPGSSPDIGRKLIRTLLNVVPERPVRKRHEFLVNPNERAGREA